MAALRTVQAFNALPQEREKFHTKIGHVLELARREANASGIFYGSTAWSGNITLLALLGYGQNLPLNMVTILNCQLLGGTLVSRGEISVGDLSTLLLYTAYVGTGLQMLTYEIRSMFLHSH